MEAVGCVCNIYMMGIYMYRENVYMYRLIDWLIDFKELAHVIVEVAKSKICRTVQQDEDPGKSWCCSLNPKAVWR